MEERRQFVIKVYSNLKYEYCIKNIYGNRLGYSFSLTINKESIKIWTIKKNCEKALEKLEKYLDPNKTNLVKYTFEIVEITDKKVLRSLKLKKLKKYELQNR